MKLRSLLPAFRPWWPAMAASTVVAALASLSEAAALVLVGPLAQLVAGGGDRFIGSIGPLELDLSVGNLVVVAAAAVLVAWALRMAAALVRARMVSRYERAQRLELYSTFLEADLDFQTGDREGRLQARFGGFVSYGAQALASFVSIAESAISMTVLFVSALLISPVFAVAMVLLAAVLMAVLRPLIRLSRRYTDRLASLQVSSAEEIAETTANAREIRLFDAARSFRERVGRIVEEMSAVRVWHALLASAVSVSYSSLGLLAVVGVLGLAAAIERVEVAVLGAVALLLLRSVSYGQAMQSSLHKLSTSSPYLEALEEAIAGYRFAACKAGDAELGPVTRIEVDHVSYVYERAAERGGPRPVWALDGVSLDLRAGEIVGVAGPSGAGKSTLAQLLLGLREPTSGGIRVNGRVLSSYSMQSRARQLAFVPQESRLLHATVAENIRFHRPYITDDQVRRSAAAAGVDDVIQSLPQGYDTPVGPATRSLSGGQLQRLAIARALAGSPSVLVLDEPTSALDAVSEQVIGETIERLGADILCIVIAHRLSTLQRCRRLVVLSDGRVEADGSVGEVVARSAFLREAFSRGELDERPPHRGTG